MGVNLEDKNDNNNGDGNEEKHGEKYKIIKTKNLQNK